MGISYIFSNAANFSNLLDKPDSVQVSKVVHKAFIEVNEEGTEASGATSTF
jgi:serpin B